MTARLYHTIVFHQLGECQDFDALMNERDEERLAVYLSQWDCGEYHDDPVERPWGSHDILTTWDLEYAGTYVLAVNWGLGYAALHIRADQ
jgi:hypothetical protein